MKKAVAKPQQALLRDARERLDITTEQLADQLGKSLKTVRAWLEPGTSASHRTMPRGSRILLDRILADARKK